MAILRSIYLKGASQKLGGVVLYQSQGRTLARELAPSVSNPRTTSQMQQRIKLANVVSVYRANRNWMRGAFEDKKQAESDYNAFVSANLGNSQVATSKSEAAAGAAVVAPYKVSSGSIPSVEQELTTTSIVTNLYLGALNITANTTVGELSQALITNNNGITEGMQLSLIINLQQVAAGSAIPFVVVRAYEMILNASSSQSVVSFFPGGIVRSTNNQNNALYFDGSTLGNGAATFILSETRGGTTRVSTQQLVLFGSNIIYNQYTSEQAWSSSIVSYGENTNDFLSSISANTAGYVESTNAIVSITYDGQTYTPGSTIYDGLDTTSPITISLLSPIDPQETPTVEIANINTGFTFSGSNVNVASNGMSVTFNISESWNPEGERRAILRMTVDGEMLSFLFNITAGDIS